MRPVGGMCHRRKGRRVDVSALVDEGRFPEATGAASEKIQQPDVVPRIGRFGKGTLPAPIRPLPPAVAGDLKPRAVASVRDDRIRERCPCWSIQP